MKMEKVYYQFEEVEVARLVRGSSRRTSSSQYSSTYDTRSQWDNPHSLIIIANTKIT